MRGLALALLMGTCAFSQISSAQTDAASWRYVHPRAKMLFGVNVRRISEGALAKSLKQQGATTTSSAPDFVKNIDTVLISSASTPGQSDNRAPMLVYITGTFTEGDLKKLAENAKTSTTQMYGSHVIYTSTSDEKWAATLLDPHTAIAGDPASLRAALAHAPAVSTLPIVAAAREWRDRYDVWGVFTVDAEAAAKMGQAGTMAPFDKMRQLGFGLSLQDAVDMRVSFGMDSPEGVTSAMASLQGLLQMGAAMQKDSPDAARLLQRIQVAAKGNAAELSLHIDQSDVHQLAQKFSDQVKAAAASAMESLTSGKPSTGSMSFGVSPTGGAAASGNSTGATNNGPGKQDKIRIVGLDDGPREIPVSKD